MRIVSGSEGESLYTSCWKSIDSPSEEYRTNKYTYIETRTTTFSAKDDIVNYIHKHGTKHRDIWGERILIGKRVIKLRIVTDFPSARWIWRYIHDGCNIYQITHSAIGWGEYVFPGPNRLKNSCVCVPSEITDCTFIPWDWLQSCARKHTHKIVSRNIKL